MIHTLLVTILVEGTVVLLYCAVQKKPVADLLKASIVINLLTQALLWIVLQILFRYYMITLLLMELLIWPVESLLLFRLSRGQLNLKNAMTLSFFMNAASFGMGWFLPV